LRLLNGVDGRSLVPAGAQAIVHHFIPELTAHAPTQIDAPGLAFFAETNEDGKDETEDVLPDNILAFPDLKA